MRLLRKYNTAEDLNALVATVRRIAENDYDGEYYPLPGAETSCPLATTRNH